MRQIKGREGLIYDERLKALNLHTLSRQRLKRGTHVRRHLGEINRKIIRRDNPQPSTEPKEGCLGYLIKLPGLSVEFRAVVLAHSHQDVAGWIAGLGGGCLQVPQRAVPLSILPGVG